MGKKPLQWHPAFCSTLQIELEGEPLQFFNEYNLTRKPLQIDVLVVKKLDDRPIQKCIGRIFRKHNIIEFKSPEDYFSVNDFYKVLAYAGIYQSNTEHVLEIEPEEITISFVTNHYPKKMISYLKNLYQMEITQMYSGVYYLSNLPFPTQVIVISRLSKAEHRWLSRLRPGLNIKDDLEVLAKEYEGKQQNPLYAASMDVIIRANQGKYEEGSKMCEALRELFGSEWEQREQFGRKIGEQRGRMLQSIEFVCRKLQKQKTEEVIADELEMELSTVHQICQIAREFAPEYCSDAIYEKLQESFTE